MTKDIEQEVISTIKKLRTASTNKGVFNARGTSDYYHYSRRLNQLCMSNWEVVAAIVLENPAGLPSEELNKLVHYTNRHIGSCSKSDVGPGKVMLMAYLRENREKLSDDLQRGLALDWHERVHGY